MGYDYGRGLTNVDHETGIRFGVIHQGEVLQAWVDSSESEYLAFCPECITGLDSVDVVDGMHCPHCGHRIDDTADCFGDDPAYFFYMDEGYKAHQSHDDPDIFIEKSPYYTICGFC